MLLACLYCSLHWASDSPWQELLLFCTSIPSALRAPCLTAEWLAKVAAMQAALQTDADYMVRAGFNLREEIGFAWRSAQSLWRQFDQGRQQPGGDAWGISQRFATELLRQCFAFQLTQHRTPLVVNEQATTRCRSAPWMRMYR